MEFLQHLCIICYKLVHEDLASMSLVEATVDSVVLYTDISLTPRKIQHPILAYGKEPYSGSAAA